MQSHSEVLGIRASVYDLRGTQFSPLHIPYVINDYVFTKSSHTPLEKKGMFDLCYNYTFNGSVINLGLYILMKIASVLNICFLIY